MEAHRAPVDWCRHRTDQIAAPCLDCCEKVLIELPPQPAATLVGLDTGEVDIGLGRISLGDESDQEAG